MRALHGLRGMRFFRQLLLWQLAVASALCVACLWAFREGAPSLDVPRHGAVGLVGACGVAFTVLFWRAVDPQLNRIGLDLLSNATRLVLVPTLLGVALLALVTFGLVFSVPAAAHSGWTPVPLGVGALLLVLVCAAQTVLVHVLVRREQRAIARAREVLTPLRATHPPEALERVRTWLDWREGEGASRPPVMIRGHYFPGLTRRAWHDAERFDWEQELRAAMPRVREELLAVYGARREDFRKYNYPGSADKNWKVFALFRDHQKVEAHCARCPETTRLVERITGGLTRDVMVSLLEPHAYIAPHRDNGNLFLTGHFGLVVPEACGLRVGEETRVWSEGRSLLFDTSFEHEAWNRGAGPRLVLLYEFLHPDMTAVERGYFQALFDAEAR